MAVENHRSGNGDSSRVPAPAAFDRVSSTYDAELARGLDLTGEARDFYARGRIAWLARRAARWGLRPRSILDFGCGMGDSAPLLREAFDASTVLGVDPASECLDVARQKYATTAVRFLELAKFAPQGDIDLAYCNGVCHHISPAERTELARSVLAALRPGGLFALWENNPWNPGTRLIMSRVSFDRDAVLLWPGQMRRLLHENGFRVLEVTYRFVFPSFLAALRPLEDPLARLPLGGQYQVLAQRPEHSPAPGAVE